MLSILHHLARLMRFPLDHKGRVEEFIYAHLCLTTVIFAVIFRLTGSLSAACLIAGAFFPVRALVWKAPWAPGHDVGDPFADYGWGAAVPAIAALLIYLAFRN